LLQHEKEKEGEEDDEDVKDAFMICCLSLSVL
jgi:hypothetical protein